MTTLPAIGHVALPSSKFPFEIDFYAVDTDEHLGHIHVHGAGVTSVPSFRPRLVYVVMTWPDGTTTREDP